MDQVLNESTSSGKKKNSMEGISCFLVKCCVSYTGCRLQFCAMIICQILYFVWLDSIFKFFREIRLYLYYHKGIYERRRRQQKETTIIYTKIAIQHAICRLCYSTIFTPDHSLEGGGPVSVTFPLFSCCVLT